MKTVGIILAGGLSSRFGSPKAFAKLDGQYFYEYAVQAISPFVDEVVIVTRPELVDRFPPRLKVITDDEVYMGCGPLAGIYSAMKIFDATRYIVLPCDMPYMTEQFIGQLFNGHQANIVAVKTMERYHPLVSIWRRNVLAKLEIALNNDQFRVVPFLDSVQSKWVDAEILTNHAEKVMKNMNYQADLEKR